jgi:hypothetical protein
LPCRPKPIELNSTRMPASQAAVCSVAPGCDVLAGFEQPRGFPGCPVLRSAPRRSLRTANAPKCQPSDCCVPHCSARPAGCSRVTPSSRARTPRVHIVSAPKEKLSRCGSRPPSPTPREGWNQATMLNLHHPASTEVAARLRRSCVPKLSVCTSFPKVAGAPKGFEITHRACSDSEHRSARSRDEHVSRCQAPADRASQALVRLVDTVSVWSRTSGTRGQRQAAATWIICFPGRCPEGRRGMCRYRAETPYRTASSRPRDSAGRSSVVLRRVGASSMPSPRKPWF